MTGIKVIGLTGGIACGKSSAGEILRKLGVRVIDADAIAHQIYEPGTKSYAAIVKEFGPGIVGDGGKIDRQKLGEIVFQNKQARSRLESMTHPFVIQRIKDLTDQARTENLKLLVIEVPLLFEAGLEKQFDNIWVVSANPEVQIQRLMSRNHITREQAVSRLSAQLPLPVKEGKADVVIYNNGELGELEVEIQHLLETMS